MEEEPENKRARLSTADEISRKEVLLTRYEVDFLEHFAFMLEEDHPTSLLVIRLFCLFPTYASFYEAYTDPERWQLSWAIDKRIEIRRRSGKPSKGEMEEEKALELEYVSQWNSLQAHLSPETFSSRYPNYDYLTSGLQNMKSSYVSKKWVEFRKTLEQHFRETNLTSDLEKTKKMLHTSQSTCLRLQDEVHTHQRQLIALNTSLEALQEEMKFTRTELIHWQAENETLEEEIARAEENAAQAKTLLRQMQYNLDNKDKADQLEKKLRAVSREMKEARKGYYKDLAVQHGYSTPVEKDEIPNESERLFEFFESKLVCAKEIQCTIQVGPSPSPVEEMSAGAACYDTLEDIFSESASRVLCNDSTHWNYEQRLSESSSRCATYERELNNLRLHLHAEQTRSMNLTAQLQAYAISQTTMQQCGDQNSQFLRAEIQKLENAVRDACNRRSEAQDALVALYDILHASPTVNFCFLHTLVGTYIARAEALVHEYKHDSYVDGAKSRSLTYYVLKYWNSSMRFDLYNRLLRYKHPGEGKMFHALCLRDDTTTYDLACHIENNVTVEMYYSTIRDVRHFLYEVLIPSKKHEWEPVILDFDNVQQHFLTWHSSMKDIYDAAKLSLY